ncbi:hypothetical protein IOMTU133_0394 [Pseudomonas aeruginosa]|nr:hypothetical protein IOMTU133_0394 [Pseudomonas aeruginosa]
MIQLYRLRARLSVFKQSIQLGSPLFQQGLEMGKIEGVVHGH